MLPGFSSLGSAWLFLLLLPLVVFYFLKLKRPRLEISSLLLWQQVLADQRVNAPFQRFKRNALLLLQLLLLALLVLAAMQPFLRRSAAHARRLPILIDVSASMAALDHEGGRSRLAEVKQRVREIIDGLTGDREVSLIAFSRRARRISPFTADQSELRAALASLEVEDLPSDLDEALRMAQALSRAAAFDRVMLFSDGNFPAATSFELPFQIDFQRTAPAGSNFGIVACSARRTAAGKWEVFVQIAGSAKATATNGTVEVSVAGKSIAQARTPLLAGASPRLAFTLAQEEASLLHVQLKVNGFDALAADDDAWLALPATRALKVYVAPSLPSYLRALEGLEGLAIFPKEGAALPPNYDLVLSDRPADLELRSKVVCGIGVIPADVAPLLTVEHRATQPIDWRRDSPFFQHVGLRDVVIMDEPTNAATVDEASYGRLGYEILAHGAHGPLALSRNEGDALRINLLFHTDHSTLPYRVGFPILVANLVQTARHEAGLAEAESVRTGVLPALHLVPSATYQVKDPANSRHTETADEGGNLTGLAAAKTGEYIIEGPGADALRVGASLLSASETSLAAVDQIAFNDQLTVKAAAVASRSDRPIWRELATAALVALLLEWWWFQRSSSPALQGRE